ncbi:putative membrane protein [Salmonella enterica subsp. enterica serovar Baildon str. R6-199]|nr:putative membrane protein [Salmonella enterica subsp. enterica serovar Baildon str. R6-199]
MSDGLSLLSLFASSFLSATLLPGNSEVVLVAMLVSGVSHPWVLVLTATMGNSLGGVTNVILGRFFPLRKTSRWQEKATGWLKRYGAATLLLSWMPVIGDLLCLLAGWMRIPTRRAPPPGCASRGGGRSFFCVLVRRCAMLRSQRRRFRA